MSVVALLAGVAGVAYYTPWAGGAPALTTIAHLCALLQGSIVGIILGCHGEFHVCDGREDGDGIFDGVLSSALHFIWVQMFPVWITAVSWLAILDKLLFQLFSQVTGTSTLLHCILQLASNLQNPFLGTVDCSFDLKAGNGIALEFGHFYNTNNKYEGEFHGLVQTRWKAVEWAPPLFFFLRYSIPLMCLVLFVYSLVMFVKEGAASYRSGHYISFTWSLNRSPVHTRLARLIRVTLCISLAFVLLIGFVWVFLVVQIRHSDSHLDTIESFNAFWLEILSTYWHYMALSVGYVIYPFVLLVFSTFKLTAQARLGWDTPAFSCVMMNPRPGLLKLQDNSSVAKHITEALWQAQRGNMQKLERLIESPNAATVLELCAREDNTVQRVCARENSLTTSLMSSTSGRF